MTDRFKFRAWNKETKTMHYEVEQTYDCLMGIPIVYRSSFGDVLYDEDYIVEQCTGLRDKNGKLIYEGDLLSITGKNVESVIWRRDAWFRNCNDLLFTPLFLNIEDYEIIGNIHENEELLND